MRSDMHADDSHNDKPGFFSKIFGHGDDAATTVADPAISTAQVVQPTAVVEPTLPVAPVEPDAPAPEPELQAGSMSDVHAMPGGPSEALDLSASATSAPEVPAQQEVATEAPSDDDMFQMPDIKVADEATDPQVPVVVPENPSDESKDEVLFDSTQPVEPEAPMAPVDVPAPVAEVPAEPAVAPAEDVEPPAPPVEEGQAWQAAHAESEADSQAPQAELLGAQTQVNSILATHPDLTTDRTEDATPAPVEPVEVASPLEKDSPTPASAPDADAPNESERQAAVVRLTNHIDDLEAGLQKVRDELDALKK